MPVPTLSRNAFLSLPFDQQWFHIVHSFDSSDALSLAKFDSLNESEKRYEFYRILKASGGGDSIAQAGSFLERKSGPTFGDFAHTFTIHPSQWQLGKAINFGFVVKYGFNAHPAEATIGIKLNGDGFHNFLAVRTTDYGGVPSNLSPIQVKYDIQFIPVSTPDDETEVRLDGMAYVTGTGHFQPPNVFVIQHDFSFINTTVDQVITIRSFNEAGTGGADFADLYSAYLKF